MYILVIIEINVVFVYPTRRLMWLTIVELDLLCRHEYKLQRDQHVSSSNTLLQELVIRTRSGSSNCSLSLKFRPSSTFDMQTYKQIRTTPLSLSATVYMTPKQEKKNIGFMQAPSYNHNSIFFFSLEITFTCITLHTLKEIRKLSGITHKICTWNRE